MATVPSRADAATPAARVPDPVTPDNAALIFIDYMTGLLLGNQTMEPGLLRNNTVALATVGKVKKLPMLVTADNGTLGATIPELLEVTGQTDTHPRSSPDIFATPALAEAVRKLGRRKLILAGVSTDMCITLSTLSALRLGYEVYVVVDACATFSPLIEQAALLRMHQAGAVLTNWIALGAELQVDWSWPDGDQIIGTMSQRFGSMGLILTQHAADEQALQAARAGNGANGGNGAAKGAGNASGAGAPQPAGA